jgi:tRNA 2-thiouridine synthesizing protein A
MANLPIDAREPEGVADVWDAGNLGCGELLLDLRGRLAAIPGQVLRLIALDPGAPEDIPAWCRLTGHVLIRQEKATSSYWIRARGDRRETGAALRGDSKTTPD